MTKLLSRRSAISLIGGSAAAALLPRTADATEIEVLSLFGPPAGPSVTLAHAVATDGFRGFAETATMAAWRNPDELRAGLTSGSIALSVVPIQAAANLYNRGFPVRLANAMTEGLLYIVAEDREITSIADLSGRTIAVPFRGDTPEIILGQLLGQAGLNPASDLEIIYTGTPIEAMQMMLAGRVEAALTTEPSTTAAILRAAQTGRALRRAISVQEAWGEMTASAPVLPQAGLAITQGFLEQHGKHVPDLLNAIELATVEVLADPETAAANATQVLGMPAPLLAASIPNSNLVALPAVEARADIERMLSAMAGLEMTRIGGRLPDDGFYL